MPFAHIVNNLEWDYFIKESRISIDPNYLTNTENFEKVKGILKHIFDDENVSIKMMQFRSANDLTNWDGTTNEMGSDRDQRGKEVTIYWPAENITAEHIKKLMLKSWGALREAGVPLRNFNPPGDIPLLLSGCSTPFSYTFSIADEHLEHHGILFKECRIDNDIHPMHQVEFTAQDLYKNKIIYDLSQEKNNQINYLDSHFNDSLNSFNDRINTVLNSQDDFSTINIDQIFDRIIEIQIRLEENYEQINSDENKLTKDNDDLMEERLQAQEQAKEAFFNIPYLKHLIKAFPHQPDSNFSTYPAIALLENASILKQSSTQIGEIKEELKRIKNGSYSMDIRNDIYNYNYGNANEFLFENFLQNRMQLIQKNPCETQKLFRHFVFLNREVNYLNEVKKESPTFALATIGISNYLINRPKTLGFFSYYFDYKRGLKRAETFNKLFEQYKNDQPTIDLLLYSLLTSKEGKELKKCVAKSLGYDSVQSAIDSVEPQVLNNLSEDNPQARTKLNKQVVEKILSATNNSRNFDDPKIQNAINIYHEQILNRAPMAESNSLVV